MAITNLDKIADNYINPDDGFRVDNKIVDILSGRVVNIVKGPAVLEMGLGCGAWTSKIIQKFGYSYIVDASERLIEEAKTKYGDKVTTYFSAFEEFTPQSRFDTVLATYILEHVDDPINVFRKIKEWVKPGGQVLIIVPNAYSLHRRYGVCMNILKSVFELSEADIRLGHKRVYSLQQLESHILEAGLEIICSRPTFIKLLSNAQMKDFSEKQIIGLFDLAEQLPVELGVALFYECSA